jgi:voltage-gated potassium channel Kch
VSEQFVAALSIAAGALIVALSWFDVFHTLLNPSGRGTLSRHVFAMAWRLTRRLGRAGSITGPASVVIVISSWAGLQILGWALIYLPSMPSQFVYGPGVDPSTLVPLIEALYFSASTLTTLGFGDLVPNEQWLRAVVPLEALTGFALLSSAAAWFIQIHGALARQRALALRLTQLRESGFVELISSSDAASTASSNTTTATVSVIVESLAAQLASTRVDIMQTAETYYFREHDARFSLALGLDAATQIADAAAASSDPAVRVTGFTMQTALHDLAAHLDDAFLRGEMAALSRNDPRGDTGPIAVSPRAVSPSATRVFQRIADDHRHDLR